MIENGEESRGNEKEQNGTERNDATHLFRIPDEVVV